MTGEFGGDSGRDPGGDSDSEPIVRGWVDALRASPREVPNGLTVVARRLIRCVARGELADGSGAFVKWMHFPRFRDRIRYVHRDLPMTHEARLLEEVRERMAGELTTPEVLWVEARRRGRWPALSVLVTRELVVAAEQPTLAEAARAATRLADAGILHVDLHRENVLRLASGALAVLDLQSAELHSRRIGRSARLAMAGNMLLNERVMASVDVATDVDRLQGEVAVLVEAGLVAAADSGEVERIVRREYTRWLRRRIRRCLRESTEFRVARGLLRVRFERRTSGQAPAGDPVVAGAREAAELWLGARALEVLDGAAAELSALELRGLIGLRRVGSLWRIEGDGAAAGESTRQEAWRDGARRFREMR